VQSFVHLGGDRLPLFGEGDCIVGLQVMGLGGRLFVYLGGDLLPLFGDGDCIVGLQVMGLGRGVFVSVVLS
jgi:hypothetical protein